MKKLLLIFLIPFVIKAQLLTLFSGEQEVVTPFTPQSIDSLQMWFDASEGVDLANFQVMSWASKVSDDTLFSYYADSTAMNLMYLYEDYATNWSNTNYKGKPAIAGSDLRYPIKTSSAITHSNNKQTVVFIGNIGSGDNNHFISYAGDYYVQNYWTPDPSIRLRKSSTYLISDQLTNDDFAVISVIDTAKTFMRLNIYNQDGFVQDTSTTGSLYYNPTFYQVLDRVSINSMLYELLVYNRDLTTTELSNLYNQYIKPKYIDSTPTQPDEVFEYLANDSTGKGAFLGNVALIGDLQYDSTLTTSITWYGTGTGYYKLDSAFSFLSKNSPFNNQPLDLAVLLGDVTNYTGISEFDSVGVRLEALDIPYLSYPGNHDNLDSNFVRYQNFYNTYKTYNAGADTMPDYLNIYPDTNTVDDYWITGVYQCPFDTNILFVIAPQINNPSEYPNIFRLEYNYAWIDSVVDANPTKNIILLTHEGFEALKGGIDGKRNYRNVAGILGSQWKDNNKLAFGFNGHHNTWRVCGNEYPTFSWTTGGFNQGTSVPNITYMEVYENKIFVNNYSWNIHYNSGTQSSVAVTPEGNPYGKSWFENGIWVNRNK